MNKRTEQADRTRRGTPRPTMRRKVGGALGIFLFAFAGLGAGFAQVPDFGAGGPLASAQAYGDWAQSVLSSPPRGLGYLPAAETDILARVNATRSTAGLAPVAGSAQLQAVARVHAVDMIQRGFFDHVNPDGRSSADRVGILDRRFIGTTGENIAQVTGEIAHDELALANRFHTDWMNSDGHRRNILEPVWTSMGVGVAYRNGSAVAVQVFGYEKARLARAAPLRVRRGERLDLRVQSIGPAARMFDLWDPIRMTEAMGPRTIFGGAVGAPAGTYNLRFYFPESTNSFLIFTGPQISVQ